MKIFCVGRNYVDHAKELGNQVPDEPVIFIKPESALLAPGLPMTYPPFTSDLHYECELVLRLCKNGKNIEPDQAAGYYSEVTLGIDFTARDVQDKLKKKGLPWEKAKAFDQSAAIGEYLPASAFPDMQNIRFRFYKNGELVQQGHTADMLFRFPSSLPIFPNTFR